MANLREMILEAHRWMQMLSGLFVDIVHRVETTGTASAGMSPRL